MSAYLSSGDTLNALASFWTFNLEGPGYSSPQGELERAFYCHQRDCNQSGSEIDQQVWDIILTAQSKGTNFQPWQAVQQILLLENQRSLEARYPDDEEYRSASEPEYHPRRIFLMKQWILNNKVGKLVGILNGYEYQSCEHDGWTSSVAYYLCQQIRRQLLDALERRDCPDQNDRGWASWTEPETEGDQPQPVCLSDLLKR